MYIIGVSAFYHDSAACIIHDGIIVAAAQEERFTRVKHDYRFPTNAIRYCVKEAGISVSDIEHVVFYEKPFIKFERLIETYLAFAPRGFQSFSSAMPLWIKDKLFQKSNIIKELENAFNSEVNWREKLLFSEHHLSHAASAYYPSPFNTAAILTIDGVGEWTTTSLAIGRERELKVLKEIHFPHSLGFLYSAFTYYTGFKVNSGEYKVMGLAPYGTPKYTKLIKENLVEIHEDGSFQLNMDYFDYCTGLTMTNKKFHDLFGGSPRKLNENPTQREMDLAASVQKVTEEIIVKLATGIAKETREENLCLAGGVALNSVANGVLLRKEIFKKIWIQPAAGDAGGALGAALAAWHIVYNKDRQKCDARDRMKGSLLGPSFANKEIEEVLKKKNAIYHLLDDNMLIDKIAHALMEGKVIGWMQGRMEFGPRALGCRSIIADPRSPFIQKQLNLKIKFRESFRPFAPSILSDSVSDWFEHEGDSPYMMLVAGVREKKRREITKDEEELSGLDKLNVVRSSVPAVTHVDYSARIQTVHVDTNPKYHAIISRFKELSGCPLVVNTSFNVRGEPIVCSPEDAFNCFMSTELDVLAVGNCLLFKEEHDASLKESYYESYALD